MRVYGHCTMIMPIESWRESVFLWTPNEARSKSESLAKAEAKSASEAQAEIKKENGNQSTRRIYYKKCFIKRHRQEKLTSAWR